MVILSCRVFVLSFEESLFKRPVNHVFNTPSGCPLISDKAYIPCFYRLKCKRVCAAVTVIDMRRLGIIFSVG